MLKSEKIDLVESTPIIQHFGDCSEKCGTCEGSMGRLRKVSLFLVCGFSRRNVKWTDTNARGQK